VARVLRHLPGVGSIIVPRWVKPGLAVALFALGLGATIVLGVLSGAEEQPTRATSALLVVLAAVLQGAGALVAASMGRADPTLARAAARRLVASGHKAHDARKLAEKQFESGTADTRRVAMGVLSAELSWIEDSFVQAVADWEEFHANALKQVERSPDAP
jgi:hypothetical protein